MLKFLIDLLLADDEPPERMGVFGFAILAVFTLLCVFLWFHHPAPHG